MSAKDDKLDQIIKTIEANDIKFFEVRILRHTWATKKHGSTS